MKRQTTSFPSTAEQASPCHQNPKSVFSKMLLSKALGLMGVLSVLTFSPVPVEGHDTESIGSPESNILRKDNRDDFIFTVYPAPPSGWGQGRNVADERECLSSKLWSTYGVQSKPESEGIAYIQVNLRKPYFVRAFAVTGYAGGSHKPTGSFFLEGSNDGNDWKMVAEGTSDQWHAPGTFPFRQSQIIKALYPNRYRHYRVIARGWTNNFILIYNWGLFS